MFARVVGAALKHVNEALDICVDVGVRVFRGIATTRLRCEMDNRWKTILLEKHPCCCAICQIELHKSELGMTIQNLKASFFQFGIVVVIEDIETDNLAVCRQQTLGNMKSNKTGG